METETHLEKFLTGSNLKAKKQVTQIGQGEHKHLRERKRERERERVHAQLREGLEREGSSERGGVRESVYCDLN